MSQFIEQINIFFDHYTPILVFFGTVLAVISTVAAIIGLRRDIKGSKQIDNHQIPGRWKLFSRLSKSTIFFLFLILISIIINIILGVLLLRGQSEVPITPTPESTIPPIKSTITPLSTVATTTLMPTTISTPVPQVGDVRIVMRGSVEAEQVFVPAGSFMMGSNDGLADERPVHKVILDAFWVDRTEVTNSQYSACVDAGGCDPPTNIHSKTHSNYLIDPEYADYPVIYVDWKDANTFCHWAVGSLPTEAEWEYVARGPDNRKYPWGDTPLPTCDRLNFSPTRVCVGDTSKTGAYAGGESWVGAFDMVGNVWEWVGDWYSDSYYKDSPLQNPAGPDNGDYRVMRGAAWTTDEPFQTRASYRNVLNYPYYSGPDVGFRCSQK